MLFDRQNHIWECCAKLGWQGIKQMFLFDVVCLKSSISLRRVLHFLQKRRKIDTERLVRKRSLSEGWTNDIKTFGACCGY